MTEEEQGKLYYRMGELMHWLSRPDDWWKKENYKSELNEIYTKLGIDKKVPMFFDTMLTSLDKMHKQKAKERDERIVKSGYITFYLARLAKELGFNPETTVYYRHNENIICTNGHKKYHNKGEFHVAGATHYELAQWLLDTYSLTFDFEPNEESLTSTIKALLNASTS